MLDANYLSQVGSQTRTLPEIQNNNTHNSTGLPFNYQKLRTAANNSTVALSSQQEDAAKKLRQLQVLTQTDKETIEV